MEFDFKKDPFFNFQTLFKAAIVKGIPEHNAMNLSTVVFDETTQNYKPSSRIVLLKGHHRGGFSFFTNYNGRKGQELLSNPAVAATFFWPHLDIQIRIEGRVDQLEASESDQYFNSRARLSQIGAWASTQSKPLKNFDEFHDRVHEFEKQFANQKVTRPPHWGGFRIVPQEIEFWFAKMGRLHERYVYQRTDDKKMAITSVNDYQWKTFLRYP